MRPTPSSTSPNAATASPKTAIDPTMTRPWRRTLTSPPDSRPASTAPTANAALSSPVVAAPPPSQSTPTAGSSTRGMARIIAVRSTTKVIRTFLRVAR